MPEKTELIEGFMSHVRLPENDDDCWIWTGAKVKRGYGRFSGRGLPGPKVWYAHRMSHLLFNGEIPDGLVVCHSCDNPACVNPRHLRADTHSSNLQEMHDKGRWKITAPRPSGEDCGAAKLTDAEVVEIIRLKASGVSASLISKQFGISYSHVYHILNGSRRDLKRIQPQIVLDKSVNI